jgi:hypothetical protein
MILSISRIKYEFFHHKRLSLRFSSPSPVHRTLRHSCMLKQEEHDSKQAVFLNATFNNVALTWHNRAIEAEITRILVGS